MKIGIVTTSRADYGLLEPLIRKVWHDEDVGLCLFVSGSHLSHTHGHTVDNIGFPISEEIEIILSSDTPTGICKSFGLAVIGFGDAFERQEIDHCILLGDRYEMLAAGIAAHINRISCSHIHGGELTSGAYDNSFRHSITKMSQLHFVVTETYRKRVIQLGEHPDTVFNVGALGTQGLKRRYEQPKNGQVIVLYHSETLHPNSIVDFRNLVKAIDDRYELLPIFIKPNADYKSSTVNDIVDEKALYWPVFLSLHREDFLKRLSNSDAIIGNSSSGIIEAPALGVPTINIGRRQEGRLRASSIIDVPEPTMGNIEKAFDTLYSKEFQAGLSDIKAPYGKGENVAGKILDIIKERAGNIDMMKGFYDVSFTI